MSISFLGFNKEVLTFQLAFGAALVEGTTVKVTADGVVPCAAGDGFLGVADTVKGQLVGVQCKGYVECRYTGTAPTFGKVALAADGTGAVKVSTEATASSYNVIMVNTSRRMVGIIL